MKKIITLLLMLSTMAVFAEDETLFTQMGLTADQIATLKEGKRLDNLADKVSELKLFPTSPLAAELRDPVLKDKAKTYVEALYFLPTLRGASQKSLYNSLLKVSTLTGLQYYSRSEEIVKTLIYSVKVISEVGGISYLPDLSVTDVPVLKQFFFRQDDETFGQADYEAFFYANAKSGELAIDIVNKEDLKQSILKVAKPGDMHIRLFMIPMKDGVLLYGLITNKKGAPSFLKDKMNASLLNRLDAFKNWFTDRYTKS